MFESDAYLEYLDAEGQVEVLAAFQHACQSIVQAFDATILQCNEQGLLLCFGYPVAQEDAAQLAVRTGLALLEATKGLGAQLRRERKLDVQSKSRHSHRPRRRGDRG